MKNAMHETEREKGEELVATFGEARLIRLRGKLELRGGTMSDRVEALEWISLFLPEEAPRLRR